MGLTNTGAGVRQGGAHFAKRIIFTKYAQIQPSPYITVTDEGSRIDMDRAELSTALTDIYQSGGMWYAEFNPLHDSAHGHSIGITTLPTLCNQNYAQNGSLRDYTLLPNGKIMRGGRTVKGTGLSWDSGDTVQLALDFNSWYIWVGVNGKWALDRAAKIKEGDYFISLYKNSRRSVPSWRVNFGAQPFKYKRPPHYAPGFGTIRRASR
jgi:hypothetical protein